MDADTKSTTQLDDFPYVVGSAADAPPKVTITRDDKSQEVTTLDGKRVHYDKTEDEHARVAGDWPEAADEHVRNLISDAIRDREARENLRANHRNANRLFTLVGALVISFVITWLLYYYPGLPLWAHKLAPFSFAITILMDSAFVLYSLIKHY